LISFARLLGEPVDLLDLDLAITIELAQLLDLSLRGVRLAFGATARELLARALDLIRHLPRLAREIAAQLVHIGHALVARASRSSSESQVRAFGVEPCRSRFTASRDL